MEELEDWKTSTKLKLTPFGFDVKSEEMAGWDERGRP